MFNIDLSIIELFEGKFVKFSRHRIVVDQSLVVLQNKLRVWFDIRLRRNDSSFQVKVFHSDQWMLKVSESPLQLIKDYSEVCTIDHTKHITRDPIIWFIKSFDQAYQAVSVSVLMRNTVLKCHHVSRHTSEVTTLFALHQCFPQFIENL